MAITKDLEIKINDEQARFNENFYIYQNDRGIKLNIKINMPKLQVGSRATSLLKGFDGAKGGVIIVKPNGEVSNRSDLPIINERIQFIIDKSLTDDLDEVGVYKLQFHIYDLEDNRITIPPVEFEVKGLVGIIPNTF